MLAQGGAFLLAILGVAAAARTDAPRGSDFWSSWQTLRMDARSVPFLSGTVELKITASGETATLETRTDARFFGARVARSTTSTVMDAASGRPIRYLSVSGKRARRYTFGEHGYVVEKLKRNGGRDLPVEDWPVTTRAEHAYPLDGQGRPVAVFDYYGMLVRLGDLPLEGPGDEAVVHVATSKGPRAYRVIVAERGSDERVVRDLRRGSERKLASRTLRLRILPEDPSSENEGFLKMEGEMELWVEATSKTLIHISGKAPKIPGRIRLVLAEIG